MPNLRRGLLRLWLIATALWALAVVVMGWHSISAAFSGISDSSVHEAIVIVVFLVIAIVLRVGIPSVALLLLGFAILWAVKGFQGHR